ncbi:MAG: hypothetical protein V1702_05405 [Candidatus Woesearchaeota archaeon]
MNKLLFLAIIGLLLASGSVAATNCAVYFTGIGCPYCAKVDPILLPVTTEDYNLVVIEYEIKEHPQNLPVFEKYDQAYYTGTYMPTLVFRQNRSFVGDGPILGSIDDQLGSVNDNPCVLLTGETPLENVQISGLPGTPSLWGNNRILIFNGGGNNDSALLALMTGNITAELTKINYSTTEPEKARISGGEISFENAVKIKGWLFQWNGEGVEEKNQSISGNGPGQGGELTNELTFTRILVLAAVNALNPCALAVLALVLLTIVTAHPNNRKKVLLAGFAFISAVYFIYLFYGILMTKFFSQIQAFPFISLWLFKILGWTAVIIGILNIRDFIKYKPGGFATEMPLFLRPFMKSVVSGVTSVKGAFIAGALVTIFLLPCTIAPYFIASGTLSLMGFFETLPWLLLYNLVFVLPMVAITLIVYFGFKEVEDISGWRDQNIRKLHLAQGILMLLLGTEILFHWVEWLMHLFS